MKKLSTALSLISITLFLSSCNSAVSAPPMSLGKTGAPVLIEEFSDIQCPACGQISPQVETLARNNPDIVRLIFYHFPLPYHQYSFAGAQAVECARDQNKGWEYLDNLFANQKNLTDDYFYSLAGTLGLNQGEFKTCLDGGAKKSIVQNGMREGSARQIPGTPSIFINGRMVQWSGLDAMDGYVKELVK
jgi:protein-disulfide isomerase